MAALDDRGTLLEDVAFAGGAPAFVSDNHLVARHGRDSVTILVFSTAACTVDVELSLQVGGLPTWGSVTSFPLAANTMQRVVLADGPPGGPVRLSVTPGVGAGVINAYAEAGGPRDQ